MWLLSRWLVRALAAPEFFDSYKAIGLLATAATLYALYMVLVVILGRTGRTEFNFPATGRRPGRQHRAQPRPGPAAGDRRRRHRPRRLLHRRAGADVRLHPAALPGALRMGSPAARADGLNCPGRPRRTASSHRGLRRPRPAPSLRARLSARPLGHRLLHPGRAPLARPPPPPLCCSRRPASSTRQLPQGSMVLSPRPTRPSRWTRTCVCSESMPVGVERLALFRRELEASARPLSTEKVKWNPYRHRLGPGCSFLCPAKAPGGHAPSRPAPVASA